MSIHPEPKCVLFMHIFPVMLVIHQSAAQLCVVLHSHQALIDLIHLNVEHVRPTSVGCGFDRPRSTDIHACHKPSGGFWCILGSLVLEGLDIHLKKNKLVQSSCTNQTCWISVLHTCVFVLPSDEYSVDIDLLANNAGTRVEFDPFWLMCGPVQLSMPANTCWWITVFIVFCRSCYFILKTFPLFNSI